MEELWRIEDKRNVFLNEKEATSFKFYHRTGRSMVFSGEYFAPGWDCSDARCAEFAADVDAGWEDQ